MYKLGMLETILISVFSSGAMYGFFKFIKRLIKNSSFKSSCMVVHESENNTPTNKPRDLADTDEEESDDDGEK